MLCHPAELTPTATPSLRKTIARSLTSSLDGLGILGIGAVWQQSAQAERQTLGLTYASKSEQSPASCTRPSAPVQFSLDEALHHPLTPQLYQDQFVSATDAISSPIELPLPLPDCITARLSTPVPSSTDAWGNSPSPPLPLCKTSLLGFTATVPDCPQWIVVWHQAALSSLQLFALHQQAELLQQYLIQNHQNCQKDRQVSSLKTSLHSIHHQLKTPLELIQIQTDLIVQYRNNKSSTLRNQESSISISLEQIQTTLDQIRHSLRRLTIDGDIHQSYVRQDLTALFEEVLAGAQPLIAEKQLIIQREKAPCTVWVDLWKITQVLQNLLHNAIAFSPDGGTICCQWQCFKNEVLIQISDQGPGLQNEEKEDIFLPFYSNRPGGTGLGLAIAKQIVLEHRGRIWAETLAAGGTQFSIVLPLSKPKDGETPISP